MNSMENIIQLKEMIIEKKIELKNLTETQLYDLIEYELSNIDEENFDNNFLNECFAEMDKFHNYSINKDKSRKIERQAFEEYKSRKEVSIASHKRYISSRKFIRIAIAVAVLASICSIAIYAFFNPFSNFVDNIKDLLNIKQGDIITDGNSDLTTDNKPQNFTSINELEEELDIDVIFPSHLENCSFEYIQLTQQGNEKYAIMQYTFKDAKFIQNIYFDNAPYNETMMKNSNIERVLIEQKTFYIIHNTYTVEFILFDKEYVYSISAPNIEILLELIEGEP